MKTRTTIPATETRQGSSRPASGDPSALRISDGRVDTSLRRKAAIMTARRAVASSDLDNRARKSARWRGMTTAEVIPAWSNGMIWCRIDRHWCTPKKPRGQKNALCPACYARRER